MQQPADVQLGAPKDRMANVTGNVAGEGSLLENSPKPFDASFIFFWC